MRRWLYRLATFRSELRRRHVFRVAIAYAMTAYAALQVANNLFPALHLPAWTSTLVAVLAILGFPVALVLAWAFQLTPDGVRMDPPAAGFLPLQGGHPGMESVGPLSIGGSAANTSTGTHPETGSTRARPGKVRLIVPPFRLLRPDAEVEFLCFSLADAVTSSLAGLQSLLVRSPLTATRLAGDADSPVAIGKLADVDVVLSGTVLRSGDQLRVSTQLVDAREGTVLWSQTSQATVADLFELQDRLARRIVESLALPLSSQERQLLRHDVPANARAYEFYLRANQLAYAAGQWAYARDLYLRSLEEDPDYAPAWARLARCHRLIAKWSPDEAAVRENNAAAETAFQRALIINPQLSIVHSLYAQLEVDLGRAEQAMVRLLNLMAAGGGEADLFPGLVHALRFCGLLDASLSAHAAAAARDPAANTSVVHTYFMLGEYDRVLQHTYGDIGYIAPLALASLGRDDEAVALLRQNERSVADTGAAPYLASLRALLEGDRQRSLTEINRVVGTLRDAEALYYLVRQMARLGETDRACAQLERVVAMGFFCAPALATDPWLDPLRSDPRFALVLEQAEARHQRALRAYREAGGDQLLGNVAGGAASPQRMSEAASAPGAAAV